MRLRLPLVLGAALLGLALLGTGKEDDEKMMRVSSGDIDSPRARTSIPAVIENLALAHKTRDSALYREQLHPSYVLLSSNEEMEPVTYGEDVAATEKLFHDTKWIEWGAAFEPPVPSTLEDYPADRGYWEVSVHELAIRLEAVDPPGEFSVTEGPITLVFRDFGSERVAEWRLVLYREDS